MSAKPWCALDALMREKENTTQMMLQDCFNYVIVTEHLLSTKLPHCKEDCVWPTERTGRSTPSDLRPRLVFGSTTTPNTYKSVSSRERGSGIRSVSFYEHRHRGNRPRLAAVLRHQSAEVPGESTFLRRRRRLQKGLSEGLLKLTTGKGWLNHDETWRSYFSDIHSFPNAVYTHCYDQSGTKLFVAGGPLCSGLHGNYAGLWS
ncbi:hypothetical protein WMY93_031529 [Mugilogobius chulae]|uniref:DDB1- and CUL4-associated factor 12 beta-propeller domain-containing protein n=1 Tax=Mugilogobius chulae TaxID=88201 RepID=A0AAW0MG38_9GOBI